MRNIKINPARFEVIKEDVRFGQFMSLVLIFCFVTAAQTGVREFLSD